MRALRPESLTWTALLGRWTDFARASLAIPDSDEGPRWRASVPAVINLQAVTMALSELALVPEADRAVGRDRAEVLVRGSAQALEEAWRGVPMPEGLLEICDDARAALARSVYAGATELVWRGPGTFVVPALPEAGDRHEDRGTLALMQPGTIAMPGEPVAWWTERDGGPIRRALPGLDAAEPAVPRQVYRQLDESGRIVRDVLARITDDPLPGLPLLVPILVGGRRIGRFTVDARTWEAQQRSVLAGGEVEVVESEPADGASGRGGGG